MCYSQFTALEKRLPGATSVSIGTGKAQANPIRAATRTEILMGFILRRIKCLIDADLLMKICGCVCQELCRIIDQISVDISILTPK
jgi:hypothetical protein